MHHSSTSTYIPNFIGIGKTFCGRTDGRTDVRTDGHLTHVIMSTPLKIILILIIMISNICRSANFHIRALRHIRQSFTDDMARTVATSLIHSPLTMQTPSFTALVIKKLQHLQNAAARIVLPHLSQLPTTFLLRELHWLPVHSRVTFKLACLTYNALTTCQPGYVRSLIHYYTPAALYGQLTYFSLTVHGFPLNLAKDPLAILPPQSGIVCLLT